MINEGSKNEDQYVTWSLDPGRRQVTHVRVLNFGRQIGQALSINVDNGVNIRLRYPRCDPRILIEVYGF